MGNNNTVQAFWFGLGSFSSFAVGIVSAMILSRYLGKEDYGTYRQILYVYNTLLIIFSAGLPKVFSYYLPRYDLAMGKDVVFKITKVLFYSGAIFSIFLFTFSGAISNILKNPQLALGLKWFSPIPMFLLPSLGIEGIFSTYNRTKYVAFYNIITRSLLLLFVVLPVIVISTNYIYAIYGWIIISFISLIIALFFKNIPFKGIKSVQSHLSLKDVFQYSIPIAYASIAGIAIKAADQFFISRYYGTTIFAEFSNGFFEIPFVGMITGATSAVLMPKFSKINYDKADKSEIITLWSNALKKSVVLIYPMVIFCLFYSKIIINILFTDAYANSSKYFTTAMILNFFNVIIFAPLLFSLGKSKFYAQLFFGTAICKWLLGFLIIALFHNPISIAIFSVLVSIITTFIALSYSSKLIGVSFLTLFPIRKLIIISLHSLFSILPIFIILKFLIPLNSLVYEILIAIICYLFFLYITAKLFRIDYKSVFLPLLISTKI